MDTLNNKIILLIGASGSGKSWICNQLSTKFNYVSHDKYRKKSIDIINSLSKSSENPIIYDPLIGISTFLHNYGHKYNISLVCINESEEVIGSRLKYRGSRITESVKKRINKLKSFHKRAIFVGNSNDCLDFLKNKYNPYSDHKTFLVYMAESPSNKKYIGITKDLKRRIKGHLLSSLYNKNNKFHNAIRKYGIKNIQWKVLETSDSWEKVQELEKYYIKKFNTLNEGYNSTEGGDGSIGFVPKDETREKLKNSTTNLWKNPEYRSKVSKSISTGRLNIEPWNKGKRFPEISNRVSGSNNPMYGKSSRYKMTIAEQEEVNLSISKSKGSKKFKVWKSICVKPSSKSGIGIYKKGEFIGEFINKSNAERFTGVKRQLIDKCLKKKSPQSGGFIFEFSE